MKRAKLVRSLLLLSLVSVLAVGSTWAYLQTTTNVATNSFVVGNGLTDGDGKTLVTIEEEEWDKIKDNLPKVSYGSSYAKDPLIKNDSDYPVFAMIKLELTAGSDPMDATQLKAFNELVTLRMGEAAGINGDNWELLNAPNTTNTRYYIYKGSIEALTSSEYLFDNVLIANGADADADKAIVERLQKELGNFEIVLSGAAIQDTSGLGDLAEHDDYTEAQAALLDMLD